MSILGCDVKESISKRRVIAMAVSRMRGRDDGCSLDQINCALEQPDEFFNFIWVWVTQKLPMERVVEGFADPTQRQAVLNGTIQSEEDLERLIASSRSQPRFRV